MDPPTSALFDVYLRLRPSIHAAERFLNVEPKHDHSPPTHVTVHPPAGDSRKRAIERFAFTRIFQEESGQADVFSETGIVKVIQNVIGCGSEGRDGTIATLGVTGSGKSHTILGSRTQRGITQMTLDTLFAQTRPYLAPLHSSTTVFPSLCHADVSEAQLVIASNYLESMSYDACRASRAATPALESSMLLTSASRRMLPQLSSLPNQPSLDFAAFDLDRHAEYAVVISMYEVYNDRIFDLLVPSSNKQLSKRRALLYKSTEHSPDRKVVAGLRKVVCTTLDEALLVLESGLHERRVAGTGSNATSSRSHGFFCIEVKQRKRAQIPGPWRSTCLTIVDLAGSERARLANTAGQTLAEAGKINSSLMYLGQCMQMQADNTSSLNPALVPFRQCKLTELLFSNTLGNQTRHHPQKAIMIVTADPLGDFNGTSQILRYSALAKEITVPRIPSVSSTIGVVSRPGTSDRASPDSLQLDFDTALETIAALRQELELTQLQVVKERERRLDAEESWRACEARMDDLEMEIRDECWQDMDRQLQFEHRRWKASREAEHELRDAHVDAKLDLLSQGLIDADVLEDKENILPEPKASRLSASPNKTTTKMREISTAQPPTKTMRTLDSRRWNGSGISLDDV